MDFREGHLFCQAAQQRKHKDQVCDYETDLHVAENETRRYFVFEPFDGTNCTFGKLRSTAITGEDMPPEQIERLRQLTLGLWRDGSA